MEKDFDIELRESRVGNEAQVQLPVNFLTIGEIAHDDVKIYIKQDVYRALEKYALADVEHERGTILLGDYCEELGKIHVIISNYIEARYTDASASTLTFTHDTWDYVYKEKEKKYADKKIVGWQHTHPSYGIFLSNYDLFIQENFFNLPFQVAYVIDPIQKIRGFFQYKNEKIEKLNGFFVYDDIGKSIKIEPEKEKPHKEPMHLNEKALRTLSVLALLFAGISMIGMIYIGKTTTTDELIEKIKSQQLILDSQQEIIEDIRKQITEIEKANSSSGDYTVYTVKAGDTLAKICDTLDIEYHANRETILVLNHITNEDIIYPGQVLLFPKNIENDSQ